MPAFVKDILRPGVYYARSPDGQPVQVRITPERLARWADQFNVMRAAGLRIPAPWKHDNSCPLEPGGQDSRDNAGWWDCLWFDPRSATLKGRLEVPREEDADRLGKTVCEVSPLVLPEWVDGHGRRWQDCIAHIALVTHPVASNQDNFVPMGYAFGLNSLIGEFQMADEPVRKAEDLPEDTSDLTIQDVLKALASVGLVLPEDTTLENLAERIIVAAKAILAAMKAKDQLPIPAPAEASASETKEQSPPTTLSQDLLAQAKGAIAFATDLARRDLQRRIDVLVETGRCTKQYADTRLRPQLQSFQLAMSAAGTPAKTPLEALVEALEDLPENPLLVPRTAMSAMEPRPPYPSTTPFDAEEVAEEVLKTSGLHYRT